MSYLNVVNYSRYCDRKDTKALKKEISKNVNTLEKDLKKLETVKDPQIKKEVIKARTKFDKVKEYLKRTFIGTAKAIVPVAMFYAELMVLYGFIVGIWRLVNLPTEIRMRRRREAEAAERFRQWRQQHGVNTPPRGPNTPPPPPPPVSPNLSGNSAPIPNDVVNAAREAERAMNNIREGIR